MWDVFISYKSKNVDIARAIADRLLASGLKVWFAEYQILLVDRHRFQEAIDHGIQYSTYGIALTNDEYALSEYCGLELRQLLQYCGPGRIIEIMIPEEPMTHKKYAQLDEAIRHLYTGNLEKTLDFISKKTGWRLVPGWDEKVETKPHSFEGLWLDELYQLDVSGWNMVERYFHGGGPCFLKRVDGHEVSWNLQVGEEFSAQVYESRLGLARQNDRSIYNALLDYTLYYFSDMLPGWQVTGVHLVFMMDVSHFAITYTDQQVWKRRYSIILVHPQSARAAEFLFTFEMAGSYEQYCRLTWMMDALVKTLKWGDLPGSQLDGTRHKLSINPSQKTDRLSRVIDDQPMANKLNAEGLGYAKQGRLHEAIETWKQVLDYSTILELRGAVLFNIGRAYEKLGEEGNALQCYKDSAEENPAQYNALCNAGSIHNRREEYEDASDYLLAAVNVNPRDPLTLSNLVLCLEKLGRSAEANQWRHKLRCLS